MQAKLVKFFAAICLIFTLTWLILYIVTVASMDSSDDFKVVLAYISKLDIIFYLTYINASLVTITTILLFTALYVYYMTVSPALATFGLIFVPIYGAFNLIVYLSQITIVPFLLEMHALPQYQLHSEFMLQHVIQMWPQSSISIVNNLAYAILGVPSILFGLLLFSALEKILRISGILLALNGVACILGFIGIIMQSVWLGHGSVVGGILFLLSLLLMSVGILKETVDPNR